MRDKQKLKSLETDEIISFLKQKFGIKWTKEKFKPLMKKYKYSTEELIENEI